MSGYGWVLDPTCSNVNIKVDGAATTGLSVVLSGCVNIGDIVIVQTMADSSANPAQADVIRDSKFGLGFDSLGNQYTLVKYFNIAAHTQSSSAWISLITNPGVPTVTQQYNPTPGTTSVGTSGILIDKLAGPGDGKIAAYVLDGTAVGQEVDAPGTGIGAITSPTINTRLLGGILVGMTQDITTGDNVTAGPGFTAGAKNMGNVNSAAGAMIEYKTLGQAGATVNATATADANSGSDTFICIAFVVAWPLQYVGLTGSCQPNQLQYED